MSGTKAAPAPTYAAEKESAAEARAQASPVHIARRRYVVGIFVEPADADQAIATLGTSPAQVCKVLVISDAVRGPGPSDAAGPAVTAHGIAAFDVIAPKLREALTSSRPFAALWESLSARSEGNGHSDTPAAMQRLFHHLVHRLAGGAAVVIVAAPDPDLQLIASRALLEAHCEVLLTHEVREREC